MNAFNIVDSPVGRLLVGTDERNRVVRLWFWKDRGEYREIGWVRDPSQTAEVERQLGEYFRGERRAFDLVLAPQGTPFQQKVWAKLLEIPYGETRAYGDLAASLGNRNAVRAVGGANGANPIAILIPCHRVVGKDGSLTGFGGGVDVKARLLALEQGQLRTLFD